jgi:hypothetical protein
MGMIWDEMDGNGDEMDGEGCGMIEDPSSFPPSPPPHPPPPTPSPPPPPPPLLSRPGRGCDGGRGVLRTGARAPCRTDCAGSLAVTTVAPGEVSS